MQTAKLSGQCSAISLSFNNTSANQVIDVSDRDANGAIWIYKNCVSKRTVTCSGPGVLVALTYQFCPVKSGCPLFHIDFSDLAKGQYISDEWKFTKGVVIEAKKKIQDGLPQDLLVTRLKLPVGVGPWCLTLPLLLKILTWVPPTPWSLEVLE